MRIKRRDHRAATTELAGILPVLQRIYAARGIQDVQGLDKELKSLLPFEQLLDIDQATRRLSDAIRMQQRILIVGDFDADGATSTALAISALRAMGAIHIDFLVPNRFEFGYGLTPGIVQIASQWKPDLIITVDNGISSIEGVETARQMGIDVLVTDHHLPMDILPKAVAIVNPNQVGDLFPSKSIAGVGVIFYVMLALRKYLRDTQWFSQSGIKEPNMAQFLDLVALGTIADVVGLDQNNRIMVSQGLMRIRQGLCRPGIQALIQIAGREQSLIRESDLGFALAPRLNAAGRLDDMSLGIECLLAESLEQAMLLASELDALNQARRKIETAMKTQAFEALEPIILPADTTHLELPLALCLTHESWHQGVIGILAGRLKERYHRPVITFAQVSVDEWKGSARSIASLNIRDVLAAIDREHPGLMIKFGGHAMAAGLSLRPQAFDLFHQALLVEVGRHIDLSVCEGELLTDGPLSITELNLDLARQLQDAGPWGQQFPEPLFDNRFEILDQRLVGQNHLKLTVRHESGGDALDAIAFNVNLAEWPNHRARHVEMAYKLGVNHYRGRSSVQLLVMVLDTESLNS